MLYSKKEPARTVLTDTRQTGQRARHAPAPLDSHRATGHALFKLLDQRAYPDRDASSELYSKQLRIKVFRLTKDNNCAPNKYWRAV
jgi:hypothetical protein